MSVPASLKYTATKKEPDAWKRQAPFGYGRIWKMPHFRYWVSGAAGRIG